MAAHLKYKSGNSWVDYNLVVYPVGAYYFSSSSTSPSSLFGGTWVAVTGKFLYMNAGTGTGGANSRTIEPSAYWTPGMYLKNTNQETSDTFGLWSPPNGFQNRVPVLHVAGTKLTSTSPQWKVFITPFSVSTTPSYQTVYAWRRTA